MIKKKFKLTGEDIKNFFRNKFQKYNNDYFLIYFQKNNLNYPRFAVIPKKEIFKTAVQRNKIKRKIYAIIKKFLKEKKIKNYDFLIFPLKNEVANIEIKLYKINNV